MTWKDSKFGLTSEAVDDVRVIQKTIKAARKRFGSGYSDEELMFLENQYQDWVGRYECNTKAQEEVFENLSICKLLKRNPGVKTPGFFSESRMVTEVTPYVLINIR